MNPPYEGKELLVPSSYSRLVARVLGLHERQLPSLLRGTGLALEILEAGDESTISSDQQMQILQNGIDLSGTDEFGLLVGRSLQPAAHGPMGYLVLSSPDVMSAINAFVEFLPLRFPFSQVEVTHDEDQLVCTLSLLVEPEQAVKRLLHECFALMLQSVVASVLGRELVEATIEFAHREPNYSSTYNNYFSTSVFFGAPASRFRLSNRIARTANVSAHTDSYAKAHATCMALLTQLPTRGLSTSEQVRRILLMSPPGTVSADDTASALYVTKRTLQRRLDAENTSYREITETLLSELAAHHLLESSITVEALANLLGYHDSAGLRKAFNRWFGTSPQEYRQRYFGR